MKGGVFGARRKARWRRFGAPVALAWLVVGVVVGGRPTLAIEASPPTETLSAATPVPPRTLGELVDRVAVAWVGVRTYRVLTRIAVAAPSDGLTPGASPAADAAIDSVVEIEDEVVVPDRKRRVGRTGGVVVREFVAVGGRVYSRGGGESGAWSEFDRAALDPTSQIGSIVADLAAPVVAPFAGYPALARTFPLVPLGPVTVAGRDCVAYRVAIPNLGEAIETTLSIGADDLPCGSETRVRGIATAVTYLAFNEALVIEAPTVATPVVAARSTGLAGDIGDACAGDACVAPTRRRSSSG